MRADQIPVITVDGPGGSGKGTLSQLLAQKLGYRLLDSGAIYRILALAADWYGIALDNGGGLVQLAANLEVRFDTRSQDTRRVWLESRDVTQAIRTEACGYAASKIAQIKEVREALLRRQRAFRRAPGLVADGRDMGTVVFPQAPLKIFLTASLEERAKRRYKQLKGKGISASLDILLNELARRDERDEKRAVAPLKPAKDAIVIDSTGLSIQEVLNRALELAG
jgi:CMP/dCMP kinase